MDKVLEAINANHEAWNQGKDYPPFYRDMRIGEAVARYLADNTDKAYAMQQLAAIAVLAECPISAGSLYLARRYYVSRMSANPKRKGGRRK
jgi:hypothetical protein